MDVILVGIGGAAGGMARFFIGRQFAKKKRRFIYPYTFLVNISGAVLLGLVSGLGAGDHMTLLLADGFLGAYTTFSTFMFEGFALFKDKKKDALVYIALTLVTGVLGFLGGYALIGLFA